MARFSVSIMLFFNAFLLVSLTAVRPASAEDPLAAFIEEGNRMADVLRAGRSVVSNNQSLINDPAIGDKHLSSHVFLQKVTDAYRKAHGTGPLDGDLNEHQRQLIKAQLQAMAEVVDENQDLINTEGMGFKGFIPAVFARLVNERFGEKMGIEAAVKVTAPADLVRNRKALPDAWESEILEQKFRSGDWEHGKPFFESVTSDGKTDFRLLIPEYYSASCLSCHGGPKGEMDVTGFPKEGGAEGDLAGAISIRLAQ
ncbi:hypothetical protein HDIA_2182 [Hartmannibacter diazotrophicus]|uniref:Tll0287-like domain-containing protein n=1 Tax=Hartmannibacter diazotrophicus TaxID=1482074 RepID=A0A2C9D651_9HYPH|nr:DUF3365 domain-containing protein [Hartmannibacter diazotrophicus]SON55723.1 hypothetical protein HDIA_2182 [Hartmannibacter diazotrophicus]